MVSVAALTGTAFQKAGEAAVRLELRLPGRTVELPTRVFDGVPHVSLASLAKHLDATLQEASGGTTALVWGEGQIGFTPDRPEVVTPSGRVSLSGPARRSLGTFWLPLDGAAAAARARFGADRVHWDARAHRITVEVPASHIRELRVGWHLDRVRVVLEAVRPVKWSVHQAGEAPLVISLPGASLSQGIGRREFQAGPLRAIEAVQEARGAEVRLTLADSAKQVRWFALEHPYRIVVDVPREGPAGTGAAAGSAPDAVAASGASPTLPDPASGRPQAGAPRVPTGPPLARRPAGSAAAGPPPAHSSPETRPRPPARSPLTIVLDPGHGGKDTGAIGPRGLKEKDVVLDVALRLRSLLVERLGARVVLTRSEDAFIPLEERTAIANRAQADFFISLHLNSAPKPRANGVETYYLSREPSDGDARASSTRENLALHHEGQGEGEPEGLKAILWDITRTLHVRESSVLAEMLLEDLARGLRLGTRGVKHGPFVVLMTAEMPSVLVEVGFLSNPNTEQRMRDEAHRQQIAATLAQGIGRFADRYQRRLGMHPSHPGRS